MNRRLAITLLALLVLLANTSPALACATCFGQSDSDLAKGMNVGILVLLGFTGVVLAGVASFFIFLIRRNAAGAAQSDVGPDSSTKV